MGGLRKVLVTMPDSLLEKADETAASEKINRSQLIRDAMAFYIRELRKKELCRQMIEGYQSMAAINLEIAESGLCADHEAHLMYEQTIIEQRIG